MPQYPNPAPFPLPARRTGRAGLPHPALRRALATGTRTGRTSRCPGSLFAASPSFLGSSLIHSGVYRRIVNLQTFDSFAKHARSQAPSLHRHYPASSVLWACPTSHTARPAPRGVPVQGHTPRPLGDPVLRLVFLGMHAVVFTPADVLTPQRSPVTGLGSEGLAAFPVFPAGRLPRSSFRGLNDVYRYYGLHPWQVPVGLSAPEASAVSLPPLAAPIPSGWNVSACRAGVTPAETQRLCTAHQFSYQAVGTYPFEKHRVLADTRKGNCF